MRVPAEKCSYRSTKKANVYKAKRLIEKGGGFQPPQPGALISSADNSTVQSKKGMSQRFCENEFLGLTCISNVYSSASIRISRVSLSVCKLCRWFAAGMTILCDICVPPPAPVALPVYSVHSYCKVLRVVCSVCLFSFVL